MIIIALSTARGNGRNYINYSKYSVEIITWSLTSMAYFLRIGKNIAEYISVNQDVSFYVIANTSALVMSSIAYHRILSEFRN